MSDCHRRTFHTWESVRSGRALDWSRQPDPFKLYPESFPRLALDAVPSLQRFLRFCCGVTARKSYPDATLFLRANPSAGALYPCELYLQTRGEPGLPDGIYHYEPLKERLCLLHPLEPGEGIEACRDERVSVQGLVLLVTAIYYRSSWKYGHRACRYCLLDSGHLLGGVEAAALAMREEVAWAENSPEIWTDFDRDRVGELFGFGRREFPVALVRYGKEDVAPLRLPKMSLPFVDGCGHFSRDTLIEEMFRRARGCREFSESFSDPYGVPAAALSAAIERRRSIRGFSGTPITGREYQAVLHAVVAAMATDCSPDLHHFMVVHRIEGMEPGLYREGDCLRRGDFSAFTGYLCLEQPLGADGAVTFFLTGSHGPYLPLMVKAGLVGQRIYLAAALQGVGCSGIGAFYDLETAEFLETDELVLYALAIGR